MSQQEADVLIQLIHQATEQVVVESHVDKIQYEDGKVEHKVYGDQEGQQSYQAIFHLIERQKQQVDSQVVRAEGSLTIEQCSILLQERLKIPLNNIIVKIKLEQEQSIGLKTTIAQLFSHLSKEGNADIFVFYDAVKAIIKEKEAQIKYDSLTKYSFLDDKQRVKVYIDLEGIGSIPEANITSRFLERSLQVRIHDYKGKNWIFAVPNTQCMLRPSESKVIQKKDKIIISIKKVADADNWFSLYKVKCVGEKED